MSSFPAQVIDESESIQNYKIRGNVVFRQEMKSLSPKCDAVFAIVVNILLIFVFLTFGIPILIYSSNMIEYKKSYHDDNGWYFNFSYILIIKNYSRIILITLRLNYINLFKIIFYSMLNK